MNDIFAESDLGEGNESLQPAAAAQDVTPAPAIPDSTAAAESITPSDGLATTADQGEQIQDGTQQQQLPGQEQVVEAPVDPEADAAKYEQEVEAALADEKTPKWYKNAVTNVYKPKLEALTKQVEAVSQFGTPEEIGVKVDMLNGLQTIRSNPQTGMPERTTEPFVKKFYGEDAAGAYQLFQDLSLLPSPITQGLNVIQELFHAQGIDHNRLDDIKNFAANGYQMQASAYPAPDADDLATIPQHLQATFARLDPDTRDSVIMADDHVRDRTLEAHKIAFETQEIKAHEQQTQEQRQQEQLAQQQAEFKQQVDVKGDENFQKAGESVLNTIVDSLAKQAGMSNLDSWSIANTILNAYEPTLAGKATAAALKAEGIELDPSVPATIQQLAEAAAHAAYYQLTGDQVALSKIAAKQVELQERLIAKGNKVIAALATKRNGNVIGQVQQNAAALAHTQNSRHAVAGQGAQVSSNSSPSYDYSEDGYLEALRQDPHFHR